MTATTQTKPPFSPSARLRSLPPYLFAEVDRKKRAKRAAGVDLIDLGVGDPDRPTPGFIIEALRQAVTDPATHRYAPGRGVPEFRRAAAGFLRERFGVSADPDRHIVSLLGSKEGIGHLPLAVLNPGDAVLVPDPGYPVYTSGAIFSGAEPVPMPLRAAESWTPDLDAIDPDARRRARLIWANYPNNPTGATVDVTFFDRLLDFTAAHDIIAASDHAYSEIYFDSPPPSLWQSPNADLDSTAAIEFHSLSKTFNMTGWRIAFAVGRPDIIDALAAVKDNHDSGTFAAIQLAGAEALRGYHHPDVTAMRDVYRERRDALIPGLRALGCEVAPPGAGFFVWAKCPPGVDSMTFVARCLDEAGVVLVPGSGFSRHTGDWFRAALTVEVARIEEAVERLAKLAK